MATLISEYVSWDICALQNFLNILTIFVLKIVKYAFYLKKHYLNMHSKKNNFYSLNTFY